MFLCLVWKRPGTKFDKLCLRKSNRRHFSVWLQQKKNKVTADNEIIL